MVHSLTFLSNSNSKKLTMKNLLKLLTPGAIIDEEIAMKNRQVFNEFNAREIGDKFDPMAALGKSPMFLMVIGFTVLAQWGIVEYGGDFTQTTPLSFAENAPAAGATRKVAVTVRGVVWAAASVVTDRMSKGISVGPRIRKSLASILDGSTPDGSLKTTSMS